ncbi:MAG: carboxypeptidase regulatory-like domain-containing protein [Aquificota bacterium]|nr:carboxypeptidase regulatory-like domain-containing protein [Aquificota bacterium]
MKTLRISALSTVLILSVSFGAQEGSHYSVRYVKEFLPGVAFAGTGKGVIEGKVVYVGKRKLKNRRKLITKDKEVCGRGYKIDRVYEISEEGGVKNAVVFVEGLKTRSSRSATLIQEKCEFHPRVVALTAGSTLEIVNRDATKHEANGVQDFETIFQISQPKKGMVDKVSLKKPGVVEVTCNIHGWMKAWAVVVENPYFAVTDENGSFRIEGLPPGRYKLKVWHEGLGEKNHDR